MWDPESDKDCALIMSELRRQPTLGQTLLKAPTFILGSLDLFRQ